jgi:hypothetical protein
LIEQKHKELDPRMRDEGATNDVAAAVAVCVVIDGLPTTLTREHAVRLLQPFSHQVRSVSVVTGRPPAATDAAQLHPRSGSRCPCPRGYRRDDDGALAVAVDDEDLQGRAACEVGSRAAAQRVREALHGRLFLGRRVTVTVILPPGSCPPPHHVAATACSTTISSKRGFLVANDNGDNAEIREAIRRKVDASGWWVPSLNVTNA